jgi:hypothetical protein
VGAGAAGEMKNAEGIAKCEIAFSFSFQFSDGIAK